MTTRTGGAAAFLVLAMGVTVGAGDAAKPYKPPATKPANPGWLDYVDSPNLGPDEAKDLRPGAATAEAAVVHYFASRVRRDKAYEEVLPPADKRGRRFRKKLAKHDTWRFLRFQLKSRQAEPDEKGKIWMKFYFMVLIGGKVDDGTDDVGVQKVGDKWVVVSVPT